MPGNGADGFRDPGVQTLLLGIVGLPSPGLHPFFGDSIQESRHRRFFPPGFVLDCEFSRWTDSPTVDFRLAHALQCSALGVAMQSASIVIVSPEGPPLTLMAGKPHRDAQPDWDSHFEWLKKQPVSETNPVDELRKAEKR